MFFNLKGETIIFLVQLSVRVCEQNDLLNYIVVKHNHFCRHVSVTAEAMAPDKTTLSVVVETSPGNSKPKEVGKPFKKGTTTAVRPTAAAGSRSLSRGRRLVTIPKAPNFHRSHMPKSCARKILY